MHFQLCALAGLVVASFATHAHAGEHWPGWRGPGGMGQSDEKGLPLTWGGKGQENVRWKAPLFPSDKLDGLGNPSYKVARDQNQSSPIVWGERVFVTVSYWPEGVSQKEYPEHHVLCFHADSGKQLWDAKIAPGPWKLTDLRGGYTAPTPACDGRHVYALFGSAVIAALDLEGRPVWRHEIKPHFFDVAIGASPLVYKDTVLIVCDQLRDRKASCILAFDAAGGALRWKKERPDADWAHSTPALARVNDRDQLLLGGANGPQGLDPATGDVLWKFDGPQRIGDTVTPVLGGGLVYLDSGRGGPGVAVDPTGRGDVAKTHLKWRLPVMPEGFSSPLIIGDYLYRLHSPGVAGCWKLSTGAEVYRERLEGLDPAVSPIATPDGRIYCASAGKSFVLKAGPQVEVLARNDLGDPSRASPAVAGGRIFLKGARFLFCVQKK